MKEFIKLNRTVTTLLSPKGCEWDQKQKLTDFKKYLLEEVYELIEAIDLNDKAGMQEEMGDILYILLFISKKGNVPLTNVFKTANNKLINRHPHVFGGAKVKSIKNILENWDKIKQKEKKRKTPLEGIPKILPALMYLQKLIKTVKLPAKKTKKLSEEQICKQIFELILLAHHNNIHAEEALKRYAIKMGESMFDNSQWRYYAASKKVPENSKT